jgi:ABC-type enterochelin transport system substrate-binding protein
MATSSIEQSTDAPEEAATRWHLALPAGTKEVAIKPISGNVTLFGADFRRGANGLLYDSLGLNGATTTVLAPNPAGGDLEAGTRSGEAER